jgi:5,6,7,8-tetrahydromethanopterin hydro-lyase
MSVSTEKQLFIGEGFEGPGVNLAHINVLVGPRNGPAGQAFATALSTPSTGHAPFVVIARPGIPTKPLTLYVNKAQIDGDFHGNATWGASQAGIAKAVVSANWVNPKTDDLDAVFENNYRACKNAILAAMKGLPHRDEVFAAAREVSNPFYTPKQR